MNICHKTLKQQLY